MMEIIHKIPASPEEHLQIMKAIPIVDRIVFGGTFKQYVNKIIIHRQSFGTEGKSKLLEGISDIYDGSKTINLYLAHDGNIDSNKVWGVMHDLCHLFDIIHGTLKFDFTNDTLIYLDKEYRLNKFANTTLPEHRMKVRPEYINYRDNVFYTAMCHYEPWETKALFLADNCYNELIKEDEGPNFIRRIG